VAFGKKSQIDKPQLGYRPYEQALELIDQEMQD